MSDTITREEGAPPLPVLGESAASVSAATHPWQYAPTIVHQASFLSRLRIVLTLFFYVPMMVVVVNSVIDKAQATTLHTWAIVESAEFVFYPSLILFQIWLSLAIQKGMRAAWAAERILSIAGLFAFPVGTVISMFILMRWSQPDAKRWFGVDA